ncbi:MAG: hypothetical protein WBC51_08605 [Vicinamibacterales bacterium]
MKLFLSFVAAGLLVTSSPAVGSAEPANQKGKKHAKHERVERDVRVQTASVRIVFSARELRVIREYYTPRYRNLPPGLRKKYARTGQLPPGWRKKMEPFPGVVERELVVLPSGYQRGVIDGHAVIFNPRSQVIVDVAVLF